MSGPVDILRLGHAGDGVTADGIYVPYTVPGDSVRISEGPKPRALEILRSGPSRKAPECDHFGRCGGCALQHVETTAYLSWKRDLVVGALAQRGFETLQIEDIRTVPPHTRRRAVLKARKTPGHVALGFYEPESRNLVDVAVCPLLAPALAGAMPRLRTALGALLRDGDVADLHTTATAAGLDVSLKWKRGHSIDTLMALAEFAQRVDLARLSWNGDIVAVAREPYISIGKHMVFLPQEPFLQPTREGEAILQSLVREGVGPSVNVADLFSGCGTFALALAEGRTIVAVEDNAEMMAALAAAARAQGSKVTTERRDLYRRPLLPFELKGFDAVVLDPPRPGAKSQAEQLAASDVPRIVYVSCSPASFARDARILADGGYRLSRVVPVDQFLWSAHVELVAVLERGGRWAVWSRP